jgi:hypothetical protein
VLVPEFALFVVACSDLPVAGWNVEPLREPRELLFFADVEAEFDRVRLIFRVQQLFEIPDGPESLRSHVAGAHVGIGSSR